MRLLVFSVFLGWLLLPALYSQTNLVEVVHADPGWSFGGRPLVRGNRLPTNAQITAQQNNDLLVGCGTAGLIAYSCRNHPCGIQACALSADGIEIQRVDLAAAGFGTSLQFFYGLFTRQPRTPVLAVARAGGNPMDAVLLLDARGVHFGPALARVLEGSYCLRLTRLPETSGPARVIPLDWDRAIEPEGIVPAPSFEPGVYQLEKETGSAPSCIADPEGVPAWVVVAPQASFDRLNAVWKNNLARFAQLERTGASALILSTLRHAVLANLADSLEAK